MMKSVRILSLLLTALSSTPSSFASALSWIVDSQHATCEGDPFTNVYIAATCFTAYACESGTCHDKAQCTPGDTPQITGTLTAAMAFSNNQVVIKPCLSGYCPKRYSSVDGRVCDWITPVNDQECGEPGEYEIDYFMQLPDEGIPNWLFDALTVKILVDNEGSGCQVTETTNDGYQFSYPLMGLGAALSLAVVLFREKRPCRRDEEDDEESCRENKTYVEMSRTMSSNSNSSQADSAVANPVNMSPVQYKPPQVDLHQDDPSQGDLSQDDFSQNDLSQDDFSQNDLSQNDFSQNDLSQNDLSQNDLSQDDLSQDDLSQESASPLDVFREWYGK